MAAGSGRRHLRHWMRGGGKTSGAGGEDLKPRGRIHSLDKSHGRQIGRRGDSACVDDVVKPDHADSVQEAWIYVRGCRIERAGLRFNSQGDVYVPDSEEDNDSSMEVATDGVAGLKHAPMVTADGAGGVDLAPADANVDLGPAVAANGAAGMELAPVVAADGAVGVEMNPEVAARLAKKVLGQDLQPDVAALLAKVLSKMEPFYHECFIDMYKVMVPLFFTSAP